MKGRPGLPAIRPWSLGGDREHPPGLSQGRSDQCTRIAWQSETGDGKAGGEGEIGHLVEPTNAASARFRHNEVAVEAHAALAA